MCVCGTNAFAKICWLFFWDPRQQISFPLLLLRPREEEGRKWECCLPLIKEKEKKREIVAPSFFLREVESCVMREKSEGFHRWMLRAFLDCFLPKLMHSKIRKLQFSSFRGSSLYQLHRTAKLSTRQKKNTSRYRKDFLEDFFSVVGTMFRFLCNFAKCNPNHASSHLASSALVKSTTTLAMGFFSRLLHKNIIAMNCMSWGHEACKMEGILACQPKHKIILMASNCDNSWPKNLSPDDLGELVLVRVGGDLLRNRDAYVSLLGFALEHVDAGLACGRNLAHFFSKRFGLVLVFITGSCETIRLKVQVHMHVASFPWLTAWTAGLTPRWDFSTYRRKIKEPAQMVPSWLWHCSWVLFQPRGIGPPANHWMLDPTIWLIFRQIHLQPISFPKTLAKGFF